MLFVRFSSFLFRSDSSLIFFSHLLAPRGGGGQLPFDPMEIRPLKGADPCMKLPVNSNCLGLAFWPIALSGPLLEISDGEIFLVDGIRSRVCTPSSPVLTNTTSILSYE